jgi:hydroxypyruvate reductase
MPDSSTVADCYRIARDYDLIGRFPKKALLIFEDEELSETPKPGDAAFANSRYVTVLSNRSAVEAATSRAKSFGFTVETDDSSDDWDYARAADHLLERLRSSRQRSSRVCLVSGGEVTVTLGNESGVGGRNQQFALYCAKKIAGESIAVLSAGTDGIDGNSPAAGAMVDGTTIARARQHGLDIASAISQFDAFPLLDAIGDALVTGPTGNNVRDLRILLAY